VYSVLIRVYLENLGPFEEADLEIKPLTIFIGKNSVGKSMLLYLLWTLSSAEPNFEKVKVGWHRVFEIANKVAKDVESGRISRENFESLVKAFYENVFIEAVRTGLEERFRYTFGVEPVELIKVGRDRATIGVYGKCAKIKISIKDKLYVEELDLCIEDMLKNTKVKMARTGYHYVKYRNLTVLRKSRVVTPRVTSVANVITSIIFLLKYHIIMEFNAFIFGAPFTMSIMLPDSRAGITRTLLKPYTSPSLLRGVLGVDQEYVGSYYMLAERLSRNPQVLEYAKPLLEELGVSVDVRFESGAYNIYVKTWTGKSLPIAMAPSGVREVISLIIALLMISEKVRLKPEYVFIEEPEAHLHPKAQGALAKIIARSVNTGKRVFITTHSDYLISALNNLILLSRLPKEELSKLNYSEYEVLLPEKVAAYLVKAEGDRALVTRLHVTEDGIPEEEFSKVAEDLLGERGRIYEAIEGV